MGDEIVEVASGWLLVGDVKIGKVLPDGRIQIKDKNRLRSQARGTPFVILLPAQLIGAIAEKVSNC